MEMRNRKKLWMEENKKQQKSTPSKHAQNSICTYICVHAHHFSFSRCGLVNVVWLFLTCLFNVDWVLFFLECLSILFHAIPFCDISIDTSKISLLYWFYFFPFAQHKPTDSHCSAVVIPHDKDESIRKRKDSFIPLRGRIHRIWPW